MEFTEWKEISPWSFHKLILGRFSDSFTQVLVLIFCINPFCNIAYVYVYVYYVYVYVQYVHIFLDIIYTVPLQQTQVWKGTGEPEIEAPISHKAKGLEPSQGRRLFAEEEI